MSSATTCEENRKPTSLRECRTFGDLMQLREPRNIGGVCKRCGQWNVEGWHYSVRASICTVCAEKAKDEVLPGIVASERKARRWINAPDRNYGEADVAFLASVTGATQAYVRELIRAKAAKAVRS